MEPFGRIRTLIGAAVLFTLIAVPVGVAGAVGGGDQGATSSASVKKTVKKLKKQVNALQAQVEAFEAQPGPQGPKGDQGAQGPPGEQGEPGPSTGPAGGDLTGTYPDPTIAPDAVGTLEVDGTLTGNDVSDAGGGTLGAADLGTSSVGALELANGSVVGGAGGDVQDNTVATDDILNGTVVNQDLNADAVVGGLGGTLQDNTVTSDDIADGTVTSGDLADLSSLRFNPISGGGEPACSSAGDVGRVYFDADDDLLYVCANDGGNFTYQQLN